MLVPTHRTWNTIARERGIFLVMGARALNRENNEQRGHASFSPPLGLAPLGRIFPLPSPSPPPAINIPDSCSAGEACRIAFPFDSAVLWCLSERVSQLACPFHPRCIRARFFTRSTPGSRSPTPSRRKIAFTVKTHSCAAASK